MSVKEALDAIGIKKLKPKYKVVETNTKFGQVITPDPKFPRFVTDWNQWYPQSNGFSSIGEKFNFDQDLRNKITRRSIDCVIGNNGKMTGRMLHETHLHFGTEETGWNNGSVEVYNIMKEFIITLYGPDHFEHIWNMEPTPQKHIEVYYHPETRLIIACGIGVILPVVMFIAPTDSKYIQ